MILFYLGLTFEKQWRWGKGCTPPLAYIMHEHLIILFYSGLTWFDPKKHNEGGGRGVPPHWHTLCMNIWSSNFIQVWHGLTKKTQWRWWKGCTPPLAYLWKKDIMGKNVNMGEPCISGFLLLNQFKTCWFRFAVAPAWILGDFGWFWFMGHAGSLWKAAPVPDSTANAQVKWFWGFVLFCSFFWERGLEWCCSAMLGHDNWNQLESNVIISNPC